MAMKIGLFMTPQWRPGADLAQGFRDLMEQARCARDNGFGSIFVGQHMLTGPDMQMFQTVPLMARLLPEMEGLQIGPGVLLISMVNPMMTAEEGATLDWMSGGNYVLAGGLGYREQEFEAMGTRKSERVPRLEEALVVIKRLWTEDRVTHHGRYFHLSDVGASVRPRQQPRPPIWLGGDVEAAVRRAARLADAWLGSPTADMAQLRRLLAVFDDERATQGLSRNVASPIMRECFVGRDAAHAREISRGPLLWKYQAYASWGHNDTRGVPLSERFDEFCADRFLLGDVAMVRDEVRRYAQELRSDHLILRGQWPGLEQREALGNIERIGKVIAGL
jgi:alkanesulfonate monooxygenase SsuD/methylene tetrahydromethanopterin reductase-like flavin-dependent oxidoreductase (luciferase family)